MQRREQRPACARPACGDPHVPRERRRRALAWLVVFASAPLGCARSSSPYRPIDTQPSGGGDDSATLALGDPCDLSADRCGSGTRCCVPCCAPDAASVCTAPNTDGTCPLPDLYVDTTTLADSLSVQTTTFSDTSCAVTRGCVGGSGERRLLRMATATRNGGGADLVMPTPDEAPDLYTWNDCEHQWLYAGYEDFRLLTPDGQQVAAGQKEAFCLMDDSPWNGSTDMPHYNCVEQGISVGWQDIYAGDLDCQWVDVTGVSEGDYLLEVTVNPEHYLPEQDYDNDTITVDVHLNAP